MYREVFIDVNVWVDLFDINRPSNKESKKSVMYLLQCDTVNLFTSCDIITTVYYLLSKKSKDVALEAIEYVNELCTVIEFGNTEVTKSCRLMKQNKNFTDLEDTIQYVMAKKVKADLILSNDRGFASDGIELMSTEKFCKEMKL